MAIAKATLSALTADIVCTVVFCHIVDNFSAFCITDYSSRGNRYYHILGGCTVEFSALAVFTVLRDEFVLIAECKQGISSFVHAEYYVTSVSAVTAVGPTVRNVLFASEGYGAVTAVACFYVYFYVIYKHFLPPLKIKRSKSKFFKY